MKMLNFALLIFFPIVIYAQITPGFYYGGIISLGGGESYMLYENGYYGYEFSDCTSLRTRFGKYLIKEDSIIFNFSKHSKDSIMLGFLTDKGNSLDSIYINIGRHFRFGPYAEEDWENILKCKIYINDNLVYQIDELRPQLLYEKVLPLPEKNSILRCIVNENQQITFDLPKNKNIIYLGITKSNSFSPKAISISSFLRNFGKYDIKDKY